MLYSLLSEDEDKDSQVLMVFQYRPIIDTERVHCKSYKAAQTIELQKTFNYGLIYVHTHMIMLT